MPQPLSSKEASLFKTVVRYYEDKQFKRGLKAAEQILKKNPKHGDTMAMKALIMRDQGKQDEAFALAKVALQCDMQSHVCWHVYGLLYRAAKNFEEAIKAYKFALRLEPESQQIQRDLALLQIQMRDYQGYVVSRRAMLNQRAQVRSSWTALAVAHHLAGDLEEAERTLTTYEGTLRNAPLKTDYENSEAVMYKNTLIAEQGDYERALEHLKVAAKHNLDRLAVTELKAKYLLQLGRKEEAAKVYRSLLERNSEHKEYYDGLILALDQETDLKARKATYEEYADKFPRSDAARRLPLDFLEGDDFREAATRYLHRMLDKGVPSTFANLKHLYLDLFKREVVPKIVESYIQEKGNPDGLTNGEAKANDASKGAPAALYFMAQHYNYHLTRNLVNATEYVDKAIALDPSSVEYHLTKARIWKYYGNTEKASEAMEKARSLDTRDRHINTKCAKYQLRNKENDNAIKTMGMFTRAEAVGGPLQDLHDMQCVWYLTEDGEAYARQANVGLALKRFHAVYNIMDTWQEDQFDFHNFVLRKGQIRAYVDMIRWEDHLRQDPIYTRAAIGAIKVYLKLSDKPITNGTNGTTNGDVADINDKKRAAKKARKAAEKAEKEAAVKKEQPNKPVKDSDGEVKKVDNDPQGLKLAASTEPLTDAMKFLTPLLEFSPKNIDAQLIGFEVYSRRQKYLLAFKCLLAASSLGPSHPRVHEQIIRFQHAISTPSITDSIPPKSLIIIKEEFTFFPKDKSLEAFNEKFMTEHKDNARDVLAVLRARQLLAPGDVEKNAKGVVGILDLPNVTFSEGREGLELLKEWNSKEAAVFGQRAAKKWPEASGFTA